MATTKNQSKHGTKNRQLRGDHRCDEAVDELGDDNEPWTPEDACLLGLPVDNQEEVINQRTYREASDALNIVLKVYPRSPDTDDEMEDIG